MSAVIDQLVHDAVGGDPSGGGDASRRDFSRYRPITAQAPIVATLRTARSGGSSGGPPLGYRSAGDALGLLLAVMREASFDNWDGDGAKALSEAVERQARRFLELLSEVGPAPDIYADPIGRIIFEWRNDVGGVLNVSVGEDRGIAYAWSDRGNEGYAAEESANDVPPEIRSRLARLLAR